MAPKFTGVLKRHRPQENINKCERDPVLESKMYGNLLASLGCSNKVVARLKKRREREKEVKSDKEGVEDEENSGSAEDEEIQGAGQESLGGLTRNTGQENNDNHNEEEEDFEACETDDVEHDQLCTNGQSSYTSAFREHLSHILSSKELDTLPKGKWKFQWEEPAIGMRNCTWRGTRPNFLHVAQSDPTYGLKPKLYKHWLQLYEKSGGKDFGSSNRRRFFSICNSYMDVFHSKKRPFYNGGRGEDSGHMDAYLMHSLNHIFRSRDLVKKNFSKIHSLSVEEILSDDGLRDQGFTRPKVLILLPYKCTAFRAVMRLIQLTPESQRVNVQQLDRFDKNFGLTSENVIPKKPYDWEALIGEGNAAYDDAFMIGIEHTKESIRLYGDFNSSDMIIASPLGLVEAIGKAEDHIGKDIDYLSSIEVLVIDHADVLMSMQYWKHVNTVVKQLNRLPSKQHDTTNIMRVRPWYLDGHARFYRQSIIISSHLTAELNSLFNHQCLNYKGKMKLECAYDGVLHEVLCNVTQIYKRFDATSMLQADTARLEYFANKVFPRIRDSVQGGVMIFINSYYEYRKLRKFLKSQKASFCYIDEYTANDVKSRARLEFFNGSKQIMLYTERAYFFWGYKVRGIKQLIFYSLPERKKYYPRIMNMLEESHDMEATVLFSRFDQHQLARIVGKDSANRLIRSEGSIYAFR